MKVEIPFVQTPKLQNMKSGDLLRLNRNCVTVDNMCCSLYFFQYCPKLCDLELHDCVTVDITRLTIAAHSHFHNSSASLGYVFLFPSLPTFVCFFSQSKWNCRILAYCFRSDGCLKIVVKTKERKRRRDSLNRLLRCCTEVESTQNTTIINIYKTCHSKKAPTTSGHWKLSIRFILISRFLHRFATF